MKVFKTLVTPMGLGSIEIPFKVEISRLVMSIDTLPILKDKPSFMIAPIKV